ncbi:hypothetical protein D3C73_1137540 [compost metagenome]
MRAGWPSDLTIVSTVCPMLIPRTFSVLVAVFGSDEATALGVGSEDVGFGFKLLSLVIAVQLIATVPVSRIVSIVNRMRFIWMPPFFYVI